MAKMTGAQGLKIYDALRREIGDAAADEFAEKLPLSSSADYLRKFKWAKEVCGYFDANFMPDEVKRLRMACSCVPPESKLRAIKSLYDASASPEEFSSAFNREFEPENSMWFEDGAYYFSYPRCFCSCVARADGALPVSWCLCSLGYVKKLFEYATRRDNEVELIESVKTGGTRCVIKVTAG